MNGKVNSASDFNENLVRKRQTKITEFMNELENMQEDIHDKLEADRFEIYEWEDLGLISEKDFKEYQEKLKDFEPTYYLDGYLSNSEKAIKASILLCPACFKSDKDMTYNPVRKEWYCTECYTKLKKGFAEEGRVEEFP